MIVAYYALHYGKEWLHWSLRSIMSYVGAVVVSYSPNPTYGYSTTAPCPDTKDELLDIAQVTLAGNGGCPLYWHDYEAGNNGEGIHRDRAVSMCKDLGADYVLVVDHDEVWERKTLDNAFREVWNAAKPARNWRVPMQHFWRSVNWVCRDPSMPVRIIDLTDPNNENPHSDGYVSYRAGHVHHFGYAQSPAIIKYKWEIHGHKNELRPGWFDNKFMKWKPVLMDVHPTNVDFWNPASFDRESIHHLIGDHPYYNLDIIQ